MKPEFDINLEGDPIGPIQEFDIGLDDEVGIPNITGTLKDQFISEASLALNIDPLEVNNQVNSGFITDLESKLRVTNVINFSNSVKEKVVADLINDVDPTDRITATASELAELETGLAPSAAAYLYSSDEENIFKDINRQSMYRMERWRRLIMEKYDQSGEGFFLGLGHFLDVIVSAPVDLAYGGGFARGDWVEDLIKVATDPNISAEEADRRAMEILRDVEDTGIFTDTNQFYLSQFADDYTGGSTGDKFMTALDATLFLGPAARGIKASRNLLKLRKTSDIAAATGEHGAVVRQLDSSIGVDTKTPEAAATASPALSRPADTAFINGFVSAPAREYLVTAELQWRLSEILSKRDFGFFLQPEAWAAKYPELLVKYTEEAKALSNRRLIDTFVIDGQPGQVAGETVIPGRLGNPLAYAYYGTTKGKMFSNLYKYKAQAFADEIGGEVVPVVQEGKQMWAVRKEWNIPTKDIYTPISEEEITDHFLKILGSPYLTSSQRLDRIIKRGESQLAGAFKEVLTDYNKIRRAASKDTRQFVDDVFEELRDGAESYRKEPLSMPEFRQRFFDKFGRKPTDKDTEYFRMISDVNNTAYLLTADRIFKDAVNAGGKVLMGADDAKWIVKPVTEKEVGLDKPIWDMDNGRPIDFPDDLTGVYIVDGGFEAGSRGTYKYVFSKKLPTRRLFHDDVLGYNVGGPRVYNEHKWFVGQSIATDLAGGGRTVRDKIFLGARTPKEAEKAVKEINNLFEEIRKRVKITGSRFNDYQNIRALGRDESFNLLVAKNSLFNKNINSVDDLVDFLEAQKLDVATNVSIKGDNERLIDDLGFFSQSSSETAGLNFTRRASFGKRSDSPLIGYGGERSSTLPPHVAIERNFTRALTMAANQPYMKNAIEGWLAGAEKYMVKAPEGVSPLERMRNAKLGSHPKARAFDQERNVILRRIANEDWFQKRWKQTVSDLADWVYDKGAKKMGVSMENMFSPNPLNAMRGMAFHLKLGLFAFDQFLVQSNQAVNIVAIGGLDAGLKGAALTPFLQMAMYNGTRPVAEYIGTRIASFVGLKPQEFVDIVEFMKDSGRFAVGREVAEQDMGLRLHQGIFGKTLEAGRVPFNEGERVARTAAAAVGYLRFKKTFPGADIFSKEGKLWLSGEMDKLTAGMTSASASAIQKQTASAVPFQFMAYTSRMMEQLFSGRILTGPERTRLAAAQTFFWGLTGIGLGWAIDSAISKDIVDMDRDEYTALRYGILDYFIGRVFGANTAFADRMSFPGAAFELLEDITNENFLKVIGGASLNVGGSVASDFILLAGDAIHGRWESTENDLTALAQNLSVVSRVTQFYHLYTVGKYFNRRGGEIVGEQNRAEALFRLMGAPLQDVNHAYELMFDQKKRKEALNEIGYLVRNRMNLAVSKLADGDEEGFKNLMRETTTLIAPYDPMERDYLTKFLTPDYMNLWQKVMKQEWETANNLNTYNLFNKGSTK